MDYSTLKNGQLYNHFPNNNEITTKSGLCNCISNITSHKVNWEKFYPRCYDFSINQQIENFKSDFEQTSILNFLLRSVNLFKGVNKKSN